MTEGDPVRGMGAAPRRCMSQLARSIRSSALVCAALGLGAGAIAAAVSPTVGIVQGLWGGAVGGLVGGAASALIRAATKR